MKFKLANLIFSDSDVMSQYPSLCYRVLEGHATSASNSSVNIASPSSIDFTTYFNSLSICKWRKYTIAKRFYLHFEYCGSACVLQQTYANSYSWSPSLVDCSDTELCSSDEWESFDLELTPIDGETLHSFRISTAGPVKLRNAYYYCVCDEHDVRSVELALASTTFKKEDYILRNLSLLQKYVIDSDELISKHFHVHVIDNGRTLDCASLNSSQVTIHPNPNVGGSGGFARGMIEALEQSPKATHVLLMDDDVEVLPESFIRTFNLLSLLKDEYVNAFLSGAMMSLEEPELRTEDLGFFTQKGNFSPLKPEGYMTSLHDIVESEVFQTPSDLYGDTIQQ